jgi:3-oxoacyl-[acyl-carrier protein] reductase
VDILINNASGCVQDTFSPRASDHMGRALGPVTVDTWTRRVHRRCPAPALLNAEFACRHIAFLVSDAAAPITGNVVTLR